ncbi:hypothetical protein BC828DRAFT_391657 [Blastocladiella britannica]|nr:hypothetical protein BC828DRAFT_391657 [Blastocladiella britannica]
MDVPPAAATTSVVGSSDPAATATPTKSAGGGGVTHAVVSVPTYSQSAGSLGASVNLSLSRDAATHTVHTALDHVEHSVVEGRRQRSLSRSQRDTELRALQEQLQKEATEKRNARAGTRRIAAEGDDGSSLAASMTASPTVDLLHSSATAGTTPLSHPTAQRAAPPKNRRPGSRHGSLNNLSTTTGTDDTVGTGPESHVPALSSLASPNQEGRQTDTPPPSAIGLIPGLDTGDYVSPDTPPPSASSPSTVVMTGNRFVDVPSTLAADTVSGVVQPEVTSKVTTTPAAAVPSVVAPAPTTSSGGGPSVLTHLRRELHAKLPSQSSFTGSAAFSTSGDSTAAPATTAAAVGGSASLGGELGRRSSRSRSRSSSFNNAARPALVTSTTGAGGTAAAAAGTESSVPPILAGMTLFRVVGVNRYAAIPQPSPSDKYVRACDSHLLVIPAANVSERLAGAVVGLSPSGVPTEARRESASPSELATIVIWHGPKASKLKKVKALEFARALRDLDLHSRASIDEVTADFSNPRPVVAQFWHHVSATVTAATVNETIKALNDHPSEVAKVELFQIAMTVSPSGSGITVAIDSDDPVMSSPRLPTSSLDSAHAYAVVASVTSADSASPIGGEGDTGPAVLRTLVWVWVGRGSSLAVATPEQVDAVTAACAKSWPTSEAAPVLVSEGTEPAAFKEHFGTLGRSNSFSGGLAGLSRSSSFSTGGGAPRNPSLAQQAGAEFSLDAALAAGPPAAAVLTRLAKSQQQPHPEAILQSWKAVAPASPLVADTPTRAHQSATAAGPGMYLLGVGGTVKPVEHMGVFHSDCVYLLTFPNVAVKWIGAGITKDESVSLGSAAAEDVVGKRQLISVYQYREPSDVVVAFPWIVHRMGDHAMETVGGKPVELYAVVGERVMEQIPLDPSNIWSCTGANYVLRVGDQTYATCEIPKCPAFLGPVTQVDHLELAQYFGKATSKPATLYAFPRAKCHDRTAPIRVHTMTATSAIREVPRPVWRDFHDDGVSFIDIGGQTMVVWIGRLVVDGGVIQKAMDLAQEYSKSIPKDNIFIAKAAETPNYLRSLFPGSSYFDSARQPPATSGVPADPPRDDPDMPTLAEFMDAAKSLTFPLEQLQKRKDLPGSVDKLRLENYLSDGDFATTFGMAREAFAAMPKWKQTDAKKKLNLF